MIERGPWKIVQTREVYRDPWIAVQVDDVIRPDGKPGIHSIIHLKPGVCVIAMDAERNVHLTEEFHYAVGRVTLEGVSGGSETGEPALSTAQRELQEELGIRVGAAQPWKIEIVDYEHARVRLHFCKVVDWRGEFQMREGQAMAWQSLPVQVRPVLPGTVPVLQWFAAERGFAGATHEG